MSDKQEVSFGYYNFQAITLLVGALAFFISAIAAIACFVLYDNLRLMGLFFGLHIALRVLVHSAQHDWENMIIRKDSLHG